MKLVGVYSTAPRLLVSATRKKAWKGDFPESAFAAAEGVKGVASPMVVDEIPMLVLSAELGALGFLPEADGGTFVCWVDAAVSGKGELANAKVQTLLDAVTAWKPVGSFEVEGPQFLAAGETLSPRDLGFGWLDVPLAKGTYEIESSPPSKSPLGKIGFVRFRAAGAGKQPTEKKKKSTAGAVEPKLAKPSATVTPGPEGAVLVPGEWADSWNDAKDWARASTTKATKALSVSVGEGEGLVLGTDAGIAYVATDEGAIIVMRDAANDWASALAAAAAIPAKSWKVRAAPFEVGTKKVILLYSESEDHEPGRTKALPLPRGRYKVEYAWGINVDGVGVSAVRLTAEQ